MTALNKSGVRQAMVTCTVSLDCVKNWVEILYWVLPHEYKEMKFELRDRSAW